MYYIGIDIGSTYVKSVLIDMEAGKARQEQRFPAPAKRELKTGAALRFQQKNSSLWSEPRRSVLRIFMRT